MQKGILRFDLNFQYHPLTKLVLGDDYVTFAELETRSPEAAEHGNADFYVLQTDLAARFSPDDRSEISLNIPYRNLTLRVTDEDEHHRNETFDGLGDIRLVYRRFLLATGSSQIAVSMGISLPTGRLNRVTAASYLDHDEAEGLGVEIPDHSHLLLGTGTFDPILGAEFLYRVDRHWMLFGNAISSLSFYGNRYGYRTSPNAALTAGPAVKIGGSQAVAALLMGMFYSGRDHFHGDDVVGPLGVFSGRIEVPNTGRFEVSVKPTLTQGIGRAMTLNIQARIPVYTRISEDPSRGDIQLTEPMGLFVGATYNY